MQRNSQMVKFLYAVVRMGGFQLRLYFPRQLASIGKTKRAQHARQLVSVGDRLGDHVLTGVTTLERIDRLLNRLHSFKYGRAS